MFFCHQAGCEARAVKRIEGNGREILPKSTWISRGQFFIRPSMHKPGNILYTYVFCNTYMYFPFLFTAQYLVLKLLHCGTDSINVSRPAPNTFHSGPHYSKLFPSKVLTTPSTIFQGTGIAYLHREDIASRTNGYNVCVLIEDFERNWTMILAYTAQNSTSA